MLTKTNRVYALKSMIFPSILFLLIALVLFLVFWPESYYLRDEAVIALGIIGAWRYSWLITNYTRAMIYSLYYYPKQKKIIEKIEYKDRFPKHIYFLIPSYKEEPWVTIETFQSIFSELNSIPCSATLIVSTGSDEDDAIINAIFLSYPLKDNIELVLQRQNQGKRIAMGHGLRAISRRANSEDLEDNSVTIFMDGDSYIGAKGLEKSIPFFTAFKDIGAVTTNELAFINTKSQWYKDWFNLKFGQRHILFQSHSLSRKVMTLTGRFSIFRTKLVITEDFISRIENDILTDEYYGKFRFLMGDDKTSWYNILKDGWNMLYLPDVYIHSLESRDAAFLELSKSLPYRWYGNTLRNNKRARELKNIPFFIKMVIWDQIFSMWTALVGLTTALVLAILNNYMFLPMYLSWVLLVRVIQQNVIAIMGYPVSKLTIPLMLYSQWIGAFIKIKAFYNLADQKWSKSGVVQEANNDITPLKHPLLKYAPSYRMFFAYILFLYLIVISTNNNYIPSLNEISAISFEKNIDKEQKIIHYINLSKNESEDDSKIINLAIKNAKDNSIIKLPNRVINIFHPIIIKRDNITLEGGKNTKIISHIKGENISSIIIEGKLTNKKFKVLESITNSDRVYLSKNQLTEFKKNSLIELKEPNNKEFIYKTLKSKKWYKKYPFIRYEIAKVISKNSEYLKLDYIVKSQINKNAIVQIIEPISNVTLQNFTLDTIFKKQIEEFKYKNISPNIRVSGVTLKYASNCKLKNIRILNSGTNPLVIEKSYENFIDNIYIDKSLNKGKGGNGYLRVTKSFRNIFRDLEVKNIRHITIQWSSAYNYFENIKTNVDINFHGGGTHHNSINNLDSNINKNHKWSSVTYTPLDANWAPPDYENNLIEFKNSKN